MIANDQQLTTVARQIRELRDWRERVLEEPSAAAFQKQIEAAGIETMIIRLQEEVETYEAARAGRVPPVVTARVRGDSFAEIAAALVRLRVARGMRQEDLAQAVGKRQPSIARWETEEYDGFTLKELNRLAGALGRELQVSFVEPEAEKEAPTQPDEAGVR
jgi:DNA-binding XRE family transcriptional regulator